MASPRGGPASDVAGRALRTAVAALALADRELALAQTRRLRRWVARDLAADEAALAREARARGRADARLARALSQAGEGAAQCEAAAGAVEADDATRDSHPAVGP